VDGGTGRVPRLVVGISRSRTIWWALAWAVGEARRRGARLLLVNVFRPPVAPALADYDKGASARPGIRAPTAWCTVTR
jgi:nucleotide-binding universal stress UspA family protein